MYIFKVRLENYELESTPLALLQAGEQYDRECEPLEMAAFQMAEFTNIEQEDMKNVDIYFRCGDQRYDASVYIDPDGEDDTTVFVRTHSGYQGYIRENDDSHELSLMRYPLICIANGVFAL